MRICTLHWEQLKTAIDERGLTPFISKDGEEAIKRIAGSLSNKSADTFDPLIQANVAIWNNAIEAFSTDILKDDAPCKDVGCNKETGSDWIRYAADGQLQNAKDMGLLGEPN
jgi:hypothetical protein